MPAQGVAVRAAVAGDGRAIEEIYGHWVRESPATFDLEAPSAADWDRRILATDPARGHYFLVAERDGAVLGFAYASEFRSKPAYLHTVESTVYTAAPGSGLGSALYGALTALLDDGGVHRTIAAVTVPNDASLRLHERFGFHPVGTLTEVGHKFGRWWDVRYLERRAP